MKYGHAFLHFFSFVISTYILLPSFTYTRRYGLSTPHSQLDCQCNVHTHTGIALMLQLWFHAYFSCLIFFCEWVIGRGWGLLSFISGLIYSATLWASHCTSRFIWFRYSIYRRRSRLSFQTWRWFIIFQGIAKVSRWKFIRARLMRPLFSLQPPSLASRKKVSNTSLLGRRRHTHIRFEPTFYIMPSRSMASFFEITIFRHHYSMFSLYLLPRCYRWGRAFTMPPSWCAPIRRRQRQRSAAISDDFYVMLLIGKPSIHILVVDFTGLIAAIASLYHSNTSWMNFHMLYITHFRLPLHDFVITQAVNACQRSSGRSRCCCLLLILKLLWVAFHAWSRSMIILSLMMKYAWAYS